MEHFDDCFLYGYDNKYHAKTETQFKFAQRIEKDLGLVCNFTVYSITRGRGWSHNDGCCSASVGLSDKEGNLKNILVIYHPLRDYLVKKKYISTWHEGLDIHIEIEDREDLAGECLHPVELCRKIKG